VFTLPAFLDVFTCLRVQRAMDSGLVEPAEILGDGIHAADDVRRVSNVEIDPALVSIVERHLDAIRDTVAAFFNLSLTDREGPSFLRYAEGGFYRPHRDRSASPAWPDAARRQVAVVVFLNSSRHDERRGEFDGGALQLDVDEQPVDVAPTRGLLVAFPAGVLHQVVSVSEGTRDTIVDWYY
jgi:predicted 2-oxoglutarate/Fe(II)-dependent dioxygenase YbiX